MKLILVGLITFGSIFFFGVNAQIQCAVDVQIQEGASISMCANSPQTISGTAGFLNYAWTGPETQVSQTITPNFSGLYTLSALDAFGCVSQATIMVTINPIPADPILSSEGNPICAGVGTTLSLANTFSSYAWTGGITTPTLFTPTPGTFSVTLVDDNGCVGTSSITLTELTFGISNSGSSLCTGGAVSITATGGSTYVWSTGEVGNTIVVNPSTSTVYSVVVSQGACSQTLSTTIVPSELPNTALPDTVYVAAGQSLTITGPSGFQSYLWSPANQINNPFGGNVTFNGTVSQTLVVEATHAEGCVLLDSVRVIVVNLTIPNGFSPNSDGSNDVFRIPELDQFPAAFTVWNRWGDMVLDESNYQNTWAGTCETGTCLGSGDLPEGTYFYQIDVEGISFNGYITLKR